MLDWDGTAVAHRAAAAGSIRLAIQRAVAGGLYVAVISGMHLGNRGRPHGPALCWRAPARCGGSAPRTSRPGTELLVELGNAQLAGGRIEEAEPTLTAALAAAESAGDEAARAACGAGATGLGFWTNQMATDQMLSGAAERAVYAFAARGDQPRPGARARLVRRVREPRRSQLRPAGTLKQARARVRRRGGGRQGGSDRHCSCP